MPEAASPWKQRAANKSEFPIVIIGSGFGGLCAAIQLQKAGFSNFTIIERDPEVGGTWYANTYPGCACDIPSHMYSFSFEPKPDWSRSFPHQPEILAYLKHCAEKYQLTDRIRFNTTFNSAQFDAETGCWQLSVTNPEGQAEAINARAIIAATGGLSQPQLPNIEGLEAFEGRHFHSGKWDHSVDLAGKNIAVVGTGASAIQIIPEVAKQAAKLSIFQRTPPWVMSKPDRPYRDFEQRLFRWLPLWQKLYRKALYWTLEWRAIAFIRFPSLMKPVQKQAEAFIQKSIDDPALQAKVTPQYRIGCKRILISNDYYPALNQDHVELHTQGISGLTRDSVVAADGSSHPADVVIFSTGFAPFDFTNTQNYRGLDGRDLATEWSTADGPQGYYGMSVNGYPNLFFIMGPNTGLGHNSVVFMIESQMSYIVSAIERLHREKTKYFDLRAEVQQGFNQRIQRQLQDTVWASGCKSWYQNTNGKNFTLWPGYTVSYRKATRYFDAENYHEQR